ncbi:hypothetical protein NBRC116188_00970 [Oceaniserpentilla sp. 4NH20-0058]|uniref:hypothetical protein n=1 Tax=Oceaniserpentilla sp. 4NH20-0058 TaxID=3127660 RepID=UPI003104274C
MNFKHLWLIRPSLLLGDRAEFRLGEYLGTLIGKITAPLMQGPLLKYRPIPMIELAETMALLAETHNTKEGCHVLEGKYLYP